MEQSYLMELIRTLSQEEKSQVREFASLSFINKGKMRGLVVPLMDICFSFSLAGESQGLDKKKVYKILFPGQNYQEGKLEKLMVEANKVIRSFLITQKYLREDNEFHQILDYSEIIRLRGLHNR